MPAMKDISEMTSSTAQNIKWILTDIDDTLTKDGKLLPEAFSALWDLHRAGLKVIAVTGRAAAWGYLLAHEWPVDGVITENGAAAFYIEHGQHIEKMVYPGSLPNKNAELQAAAKQALAEFPRARPAQDNHLREFDWAIDYAENVVPPLSQNEVEKIVQIFKDHGCKAQPSSIHINTWNGLFNKKEASVHFLRQRYNYNSSSDAARVMYVGDALNDEPMFAHFENSCAVANVRKWLQQMKHHPSYISTEEYGAGFAQIVSVLLSKRQK